MTTTQNYTGDDSKVCACCNARRRLSVKLHLNSARLLHNDAFYWQFRLDTNPKHRFSEPQHSKHDINLFTVSQQLEHVWFPFRFTTPPVVGVLHTSYYSHEAHQMFISSPMKQHLTSFIQLSIFVFSYRHWTANGVRSVCWFLK